MSFFRPFVLVLAVLGLSGLWSSVQGQQDIQYTQFIFNKLHYNPAYAGNNCLLCGNLMYRRQWIGIVGAPTSQTFNLHGSLLQEKLGLGLSVNNDAIGLTNVLNIETSYAYRLQFKPDEFLSIGLRGSINFLRMRWSDADPTQVFDFSIPGADGSKIYPNFGLGFYYENSKFFAGLSIPRLFRNTIPFTENYAAMMEPRLQQHYYLMGGVVLPISSNVEISPAALLKYTSNAPLSLDLNVNFIFYKRLWLGVSYRTGDSVDGLLQVAILPNLKLGLAYDVNLSRLRAYNSGTLEVNLEYCLQQQGLRLNNPRYF